MGSRIGKALLGALAVGVSGALVFTACGEREAPEEQPAPAAVEETPEPEPEPIVLPACDLMNAAAQQEYEEFGPEKFSEPAGEIDLATFTELGGPIAEEAMGHAVQQRGCRWPVHFQGTVTHYVAELPAAAQRTITTALRADPEVDEAPLGTAVSFTYTAPAPHPMMSGTQVTHLFVGDVWVVMFNSAGQREYAQAALDGVLAANPALAQADDDAAREVSCSGLSAEEALQKWGAEVERGPWDMSAQYSDVSGYSECEELSWIVLRPESCCTRFSMTPVLFFHHGVLVPGATVTGYALGADIERISASEASVTFMWPGEDLAGDPGTAVSSYRWDADSRSVLRSGDLPPA